MSAPSLRRAPVQFWMMGTFGLFVGLSVVLVAIYALFLLRPQVRQGNDLRLNETATELASRLRGAEASEDLQAEIRSLSEMVHMRLTIHDGTTAIADWDSGEEASSALPASEFDNRRTEVHWSKAGSGSPPLVTTHAIPNSGSYIRIAWQPEVFGLSVAQAQFLLIASSILALLLALIGSWIASTRVTDPLAEITDSARRISDGHPEEISMVSRAAEFQDLSRILNRMADRFQDDIDKLQSLIQIQNEFLGNVSHEVRNPVFAVGGYLEALGDSSLDESQRKNYAQKGIANLERLNALFSDLIEIARLEYREDLIQSELFALDRLVQEVAETARPKARDKNLALEVSSRSVSVYADRARIAQVLTNLIENAIAYTDNGKVMCRYRRIGEIVRVEISDTGRGIDEEHLDRIFDRFYRVDTARSRKHGGTGLGLSIVKQILNAHGSSVSVESALGKGTRFSFELPALAPAQPARQLTEPESEALS